MGPFRLLFPTCLKAPRKCYFSPTPLSWPNKRKHQVTCNCHPLHTQIMLAPPRTGPPLGVSQVHFPASARCFPLLLVSTKATRLPNQMGPSNSAASSGSWQAQLKIVMLFGMCTLGQTLRCTTIVVAIAPHCHPVEDRLAGRKFGSQRSVMPVQGAPSYLT